MGKLMSNNLLKPRSTNHEKKDKILLEHKQCIQARYYNRHTCNFLALTEGEVVRMYPYKKENRVWEKGIVNQCLDEHSYMVKTPSRSYQHKRNHLQRSSEKPQTIECTPTRQLEQAQTPMEYTPTIQPPSAVSAWTIQPLPRFLFTPSMHYSSIVV